MGEDDGKAPLAKVVDEGVSSELVEDVGEAHLPKSWWRHVVVVC